MKPRLWLPGGKERGTSSGETPPPLLAPLGSSTHFAEENEGTGYELFLASVLGLGLPLPPGSSGGAGKYSTPCYPQAADVHGPCEFQLHQIQAG